MAGRMRTFYFLTSFIGVSVALQSGQREEEHGQREVRALLVTMVYPTDELPVDLMLEHHIRMIAGSSSSISEVAVIENQPPWAEKRSPHESTLSRFRRTYGSTGRVNVRTVDYTRLNESGFLSRFFRVVDHPTNMSSEESYAEKDITDLQAEENSTDGSKTRADRFLGMLNFLELCKDADDAVNLCIFVEPGMFMYRTKAFGILEQASLLFQQDSEAMVLNPPDLCQFSKPAVSGQCSTSHADALRSQLMVVSRPRLTKALPLKVQRADMERSFDALFMKGLTQRGAKPVKKMVCGGAFAIRPYSLKYSCRGPQMIGAASHARRVAHATGATSLSPLSGYPEVAYKGFSQTAVAGLPLLIQRIEAGKFPKTKYPDSVTNRCQDMCPSKERIEEGFAW